MLALLKADSFELRLTLAAVAEECIQTNRKLPISVAAMQPSAALVNAGRVNEP